MFIFFQKEKPFDNDGKKLPDIKSKTSNEETTAPNLPDKMVFWNLKFSVVGLQLQYDGYKDLNNSLNKKWHSTAQENFW